MYTKGYPVIDLVATGDNIKRLRLERGLTVRDLQKYFGFEEPQAIYKWQRGLSLPTVDNLYALGNLFELSMDEILVPVTSQLHIVGEQQGEPCCSSLFFRPAILDTARVRCNFDHFSNRNVRCLTNQALGTGHGCIVKLNNQLSSYPAFSGAHISSNEA